jgi:hypothetical protein
MYKNLGVAVIIVNPHGKQFILKLFKGKKNNDFSIGDAM